MSKIVIAQIGTFDVENYGDLLFPDILKSKLNGYEIDLFSPNGGKKPFESATIVYPLRELEEKIKTRKYRALIVGGGDIIRLDSAIANRYKNNYSPALAMFVFPILLANKYNLKIIFNAPGVPFRFSENERVFIKELLRGVDYISIRGENSKAFLEECGEFDIKIVPDTVLCISNVIKLSTLKLVKEEIEVSKIKKKLNNYIVIQHNQYNNANEDYVNALREFITFVTDKYKLNVVLLPIGYVHQDIKIMSKLVDKDNKMVTLIKGKLSPKEMLSIIANSKGYIGTSMHGAITAYSYERPILMINTKYNSKRNEFLKLIGRPELEVNSIFLLRDIFEKYFFNSTIDLEPINRAIDKHFEAINNVIKKNKTGNEGFDLAIVQACLVSLINEKRELLKKVKVYYDNDGFSEENTELVDCVYRDKKLIVEIFINRCTKRIRIDPLEGDILKYKNLNIYLDGKLCNDYIVPNLYCKNNLCYIWSMDPQIIIDISNDVTSLKIEIDDLDILSKEEIFNYMKTIPLKEESSLIRKLRNLIRSR